MEGEVCAHCAAVEETVEGGDGDEPDLIVILLARTIDVVRAGELPLVTYLLTSNLLPQRSKLLLPGTKLIRHWYSTSISSSHSSRSAEKECPDYSRTFETNKDQIC